MSVFVCARECARVCVCIWVCVCEKEKVCSYYTSAWTIFLRFPMCFCEAGLFYWVQWYCIRPTSEYQPHGDSTKSIMLWLQSIRRNLYVPFYIIALGALERCTVKGTERLDLRLQHDDDDLPHPSTVSLISASMPSSTQWPYVHIPTRLQATSAMS